MAILRIMAAYSPRGTLLAVLACILAAACAGGRDVASAHGVETVPLHILARNMEDYVGRTVRTCGRSLDRHHSRRGTAAWSLSAVDPLSAPYRFRASVIVRSCGDRRPRLEDGCVTGRIAQEDGSLEPAPEARIVMSHHVMDFEWWIHPACP